MPFPLVAVGASLLSGYLQNQANKSATSRALGQIDYKPDQAAFEDKFANQRRGELSGLSRDAGESGFRGSQDRLVGLLEDRLSGKSKSRAQLLQERGLRRAQASTLGTAQAVPQVGGLGLRNILKTQQDLQNQANEQSEILQLQEDQQNIGALSGLLGQGRQGDISQIASRLAIQRQKGTEDQQRVGNRIAREQLIAGNKRAGASIAAGGAKREGDILGSTINTIGSVLGKAYGG